MRVCCDISAGLAQGAGIGRYARELALALHRMPNGPELVLFHNRQPLDRLPPELGSVPRVGVGLGNKAWRAVLLAGKAIPAPWNRDIARCDLFHGTDSVAPHPPRPVVITIHDLSTLLFPSHHTTYNRLYQRVALPIMARRATAIIADSESTRRDVIRLLGSNSDKVRTIYLGVDHSRFHPRAPAEARERVRAALGIEAPYILALGTIEPRKNLAALLKAYTRLGSDAPGLVLAGARGWHESPLFDLVRELGLEGRVQFPDYVPDELLPDLYAGAGVFVYPSLYEGFGLPVLEAMACGAPVITSNTSSLPEVAGQAASLVDPTDVDKLSSHIGHVMGSEQAQASMREAGIAQAARFTWERTARETVDVYRSVIRRQ